MLCYGFFMFFYDSSLKLLSSFCEQKWELSPLYIIFSSKIRRILKTFDAFPRTFETAFFPHFSRD